MDILRRRIDRLIQQVEALGPDSADPRDALLREIVSVLGVMHSQLAGMQQAAEEADRRTDALELRTESLEELLDEEDDDWDDEDEEEDDEADEDDGDDEDDGAGPEGKVYPRSIFRPETRPSTRSSTGSSACSSAPGSAERRRHALRAAQPDSRAAFCAGKTRALSCAFGRVMLQ